MVPDIILALTFFVTEKFGPCMKMPHNDFHGGIELVSKELNHFWGITLFFRDWALGTLTGAEIQRNPPKVI